MLAQKSEYNFIVEVGGIQRMLALKVDARLPKPVSDLFAPSPGKQNHAKDDLIQTRRPSCQAVSRLVEERRIYARQRGFRPDGRIQLHW